MSISKFQFDPYFGRTINKNLIPNSSASPVGKDQSLAYFFYKKLSGLREILKTKHD